MSQNQTKHSFLMGKIFTWPVVGALMILMFGTAHFQIPHTPGSHEGYLFTLAGQIGMCSTFIIGALLERSYPDIFSRRGIVFYRFWLASCSLLSLALWFILRAFPLPVWDVNRSLLTAVYFGALATSVVLARLIARSSKPDAE